MKTINTSGLIEAFLESFWFSDVSLVSKYSHIDTSDIDSVLRDELFAMSEGILFAEGCYFDGHKDFYAARRR
ncbi:MAG: hypothetical protein LBS29_04550 [Endomicrobium sp.]|nr:hypothetical protein [Endomicrobium sp.]